MRVAIISRNRKLYSIQRLLKEAAALRLQCDVINPFDCQLFIHGTHSHITYRNQVLPRYHSVLPRIGASVTEIGLSVVKHFEVQGIPVVNSSLGIAESRNKLRALQVLTQHHIQVPATVLTHHTRGLRKVLQYTQGLPVIIKMLQGTQGIGVMLIDNIVSLHSVLDTLQYLEQEVLIQRFVSEGAGKDYRVFIVGNKVIASMRRTAKSGEFRSNIHQGGKATIIDLPRKYKQTALRAAKVFGLNIAGVDLMESEEGPLVLEVNSSPGFEGIEKVTGLNIAREIMKEMKRLGGSKRAGL